MLIHILLLILKILGYAILGVLGLLIFVLFLALVVPIRYKIIGRNDEKMDLVIRFSYLLWFVRGLYEISKEKKEFSLTWLFGLIKFKPKKKKKDYTQDFFEDENDEEAEDDDDSKDFEEDSAEDPEISFDDDDGEDEKNISSKTVKHKKTAKKKSSSSSKIALLKQYFNEANKRAVAYTLKQVGYILKKYLPRKASGNLYFGAAEPSITGEICGILSLFPIIYQKGLNIYPDFESDNYYASGKLEAKGFVQLGILVIALLRLLINKDTRSLIKLLIKK